MPLAGSFFDIRNRPTIKGPVNPLDTCTIISCYPKQIIDFKHTLNPGMFIIEKGSKEKPSLTLIGPSSWWKDMDLDQPLVEIVIGSVQMADSVIKDYCNGLFGCNMGDSMPGLFFAPGGINEEKLRSDKLLQAQLEAAWKKQQNWYSFLVKWADSFWSRSNGNPLTIMDDMRMAARELGLDKEWAKDHIVHELIRCVFCGALRNPKYPKCGNCLEIVDKVLAKQLGLIV